jgi:FkbH-like protein
MNIKLIIWDLDDTFWKGTLSEGPIQFDQKKIDLVKHMVDRGVMNSICSKNDFNEVKKVLEPTGLWDYFVFPSIDWTPKAPRIASIIKTMALRPVNVLFIDDNPINLNEAKFYLPELNVLDVKDIESFIEEYRNIGKDDSEHKRLKQYRVMETKVQESQNYDSTNEFLRQSEIQVTFNHDCTSIVDRIVEMIERTNQLNYTKLRSNKEEVLSILNNPEYKCATVSVKDKYGDYGTVGFYALHQPTSRLLHFLFSCRTLGMGIEQFVYEELGFPELDVIGEVANSVTKEHTVTWINSKESYDCSNNVTNKNNIQSTPPPSRKLRVLLKGPCDLQSVYQYLSSQRALQLDTEFNFVNQDGVSITAMNHTIHLLESVRLSNKEKADLLKDVPFMDTSVFESKLFTQEYDYVFMSMLPDCHEGVYRHKKSGQKITFSSANYDLTAPKNWSYFISGEYTNHNFKFTEESLKAFAEKFTFEGFMDAQEIIHQIRFVRENILPHKTQLILVLGSEIECESQTTNEFAHHANNHQHVNQLLKSTFGDKGNIGFINVTDFIKSQNDFNGCTNHFTRQVYYQLANEIANYVNTGESKGKMRIQPNWEVTLRSYARRLKRRLSRLR